MKTISAFPPRSAHDTVDTQDRDCDRTETAHGDTCQTDQGARYRAARKNPPSAKVWMEFQRTAAHGGRQSPHIRYTPCVQVHSTSPSPLHPPACGCSHKDRIPYKAVRFSRGYDGKKVSSTVSQLNKIRIKLHQTGNHIPGGKHP